MSSTSINPHSVTDSEAGELKHTAALHQSWGSCKVMYIPRLWAASQLAPLWILTFKHPDQSKARMQYLETWEEARLWYQQPHQTFIFVPRWPGFWAKSLGRTDGQGIQILDLLLCSQQGSQRVPTEACASMWALGAGRVLMHKAHRCPQATTTRLWSGLRIPYRSPLHLAFCAEQSVEPGGQYTSLSPQRHHRFQVQTAQNKNDLRGSGERAQSTKYLLWKCFETGCPRTSNPLPSASHSLGSHSYNHHTQLIYSF